MEYLIPEPSCENHSSPREEHQLGHRRSDHWSPRRPDYLEVNLKDRDSQHHQSRRHHHQGPGHHCHFYLEGDVILVRYAKTTAQDLCNLDATPWLVNGITHCPCQAFCCSYKSYMDNLFYH
jgi:hypothetical protein